MKSPRFRHELKYLCSGAQLKNLKIRLSGLMLPDPHAATGKYLIRSIYFDDYYQSRVLANEAGTSPREKWRIRAYNADPSFISLECKRKEHGMILKTSCTLSSGQYQHLLDASGTIIGSNNDALLNRFLYEQQTMLLRPSVIVQYTRIPFVWPLGNVRVTFDLDIASSDKIKDFFCQDIPCRPILPAGMHLLEVKYDEYIPDYIYHAVQMEDMQQVTFSKYCLCRQFNRRGVTAL